MVDPILLECRQVTKKFGQKVALHNVSLSIPQGKICGLLGPNGAGKTTFIRLIMDILKPDQGTIRLVDLFDDRTRKNFIGYLPEERGLYVKEKVGDTLLYFAMLKGLSRKNAKIQVKHFLNRLDMMNTVDMKIGKLSKGNQQKIQLISAIVSYPHLLILDEPFTGLDPVNVHMVIELLKELQKKMTIILSTHQMNKVETLCQNVILINNGTLIFNDEMMSLIGKYSGDYYVVETKRDLPESELFTIHERNQSSVKIKLSESVHLDELLQWLGTNKLGTLSVTPFRMSLSDIFIAEVRKKEQ